jgi:hypothetical protein
MTSPRVSLVIALAAAVMCTLPASATAPTGPGTAKELAATLTVTVIHAQNDRPGVDATLGALAKYLKQSFSDYKGFNLLGAHTATLAVNGTKSSKLPDGKTMTLKFLGTAKGFVKLHLELDGLKTTVDVRDGGLFFQAGRVYKGGILVLAIGAETGPSSTTRGR